MNDWKRFSRLPQSPKYWDALAGRIQESVHAKHRAPAPAVRSIAPFVWTAIAAGLIAVLASTMMPAVTAAPTSMRSSLMPADSVAARWLELPAPPSGAEMLFARMAGTP